MRSTPSLRSFPNVSFETVPISVWLSMALKKSQDRVHKPRPFQREGRAEAESSRGPSAYQPNALPLGQTGSLMLQSEDSNRLIDPFRLSRCRKTTTSQSTTKFYNSSKAGVGRNVLTLTSCVLRSDRTESVWMPTDLVWFPVQSIRLLRKKLRRLAGLLSLLRR